MTLKSFIMDTASQAKSKEEEKSVQKKEINE